MGLKEDFDTAAEDGYYTSKTGPFVLRVRFYDEVGAVLTSYDFAARKVYTRLVNNNGENKIQSFNDYDRDVLETFRQRLIGLGGNPPELLVEDNKSILNKTRPLGRNT